MHSIIFHAHQKIDRVAYQHLKPLLPEDDCFPGIRQVLRFEGRRGPDSTNLKRHKKGQPWHFVNPLDEQDTDLHDQIDRHYRRLVAELKRCDDVRAAFEAAWLAHALVDGLTPAHHYPYETELEHLRGGESRHTRTGLLDRLYVRSDTVVETVHRSLKLIGPKGLLTSHAMFEAGAYAIIAPMRFGQVRPSPAEVEKIRHDGVVTMFRQLAKEVAQLNLYSRFCDSGWVRPVIKDVRHELGPRMINAVTLSWYAAAQEARPV